MKHLTRLKHGLIDWLIQRAQRTPYVHLTNADGTPYMDRFWLLRIGRTGVDSYGQPRPWIALRVHHIRSSDQGELFHDHPWPFFSWIMRGGYFERTPFTGHWRGTPPTAMGRHEPYIEAWRGSGALLFRRASAWHRLHLPGWLLPDGAWTLVLTLPLRQSWGFRTRHGRKVDHRDYLAAQACQAQQGAP